MGYVKQVINLKGRTSLNIVMQEDANLLEEVVVSTGYGTQRKADLSGSVVSVSKEDIKGTPTSNVMEALQGKIAVDDASFNTSICSISFGFS